MRSLEGLGSTCGVGCGHQHLVLKGHDEPGLQMSEMLGGTVQCCRPGGTGRERPRQQLPQSHPTGPVCGTLPRQGLAGSTGCSVTGRCEQVERSRENSLVTAYKTRYFLPVTGLPVDVLNGDFLKQLSKIGLDFKKSCKNSTKSPPPASPPSHKNAGRQPKPGVDAGTVPLTRPQTCVSPVSRWCPSLFQDPIRTYAIRVHAAPVSCSWSCHLDHSVKVGSARVLNCKATVFPL